MSPARPSHRAPLPPAQGFTLIELLVAIFIAAIIFALGYGGVRNGLRDREALAKTQQRLTDVQTAMRLLVQDFSQLAPRPVRDPLGAGLEPAILSTPVPGTLVAFTRAGWANPAGVQRPALQRVQYVLDNGTLRREHWRVLDRTLDSVPVRRDLLDRVKSAKVRYMNQAHQWQDDWPVQGNVPALLRARPLAVEVTLELEDYGTLMRIVEAPG